MVPIPIPSSTWSRLKAILGRSLVDIVWIALVTAGILLVFYVLIAFGPLGYVVAAALAGSLVNERIREAVADVYRRDFATL